MLIKVFDKWINPDKKVCLAYNKGHPGKGEHVLYPPYVYVILSRDGVKFEDKTLDEVAEEINGQLDTYRYRKD